MTAPALSVSTPFGRYYYNPARQTQVPSITNIKGKKSIDSLKYWAAKEAARYAADNIEKLYGLTPDEVFRLVKSAPFSNDSPRAESSAIGDLVHDWIDRYIKNDAPSADEVGAAAPTARHMWRQFSNFVQHYKPDWQDSEFTVWSERFEYAGTADWSARINGALVLGDTKTGKAIYPDYAMQLAALAKADYILEPDGSQRPLPKFERFGLLHVRPTFTRLVPVDLIDECFKQFLALKIVFDFDVQFSDAVLLPAPKLEAPRLKDAA
jgi:hypothetical protein